MIHTLIKNKIIVYLASRYGTYAVQFIISMSIATKLGPYYLGIYGFINLVLSYFGQVNFGVPHSLNVLIVHHKSEKAICDNSIGNSLWLYTILSIVVILIFATMLIFNINFSSDYPIRRYMPMMTIIAVMTYMNAIFTCVLRVRNKVHQLSIVQSILVVLNLIAVVLFSGEYLIMALVACNVISGFITLFITLKANVVPNRGDVSLSTTVQKEIMSKGIYLFFYNSCFYFIMISIRTFVSNNYEVVEFGAFTFSFTVAGAVMLLLDSLMTIIFPKIIDMLSSHNYKEIEKSLEVLRASYISSSHLMIYIALIAFPIFLLLMPKYSNAITSMNLIALAILMNTNSCGYSALLIAQNKEKISAYISGTSLLINIILGFVLVNICHVSFSYVIIATLITYLYFTYMCVNKGKRIFGNASHKETLMNFFPKRLLVPYVTAFIISCMQVEYLIWVPLVLYLILNWRDVLAMKDMAYKLINNPNIADV